MSERINHSYNELVAATWDEKRPPKREPLAVDFDGVIHSAISPLIKDWLIPDAPVPGAIEWLSKVHQTYDVRIFTTRGRTWRGRRAIRKWLEANTPDHLWWDSGVRHGLVRVPVLYKPYAWAYVDDRGLRFSGTFPSVRDLRAATPWHQKAAW